MKKLYLLGLVMVILLFSIIFLSKSINSAPAQDEYLHQEEYVANEVLVKFRKDVPNYFIKESIDLVQGKIITYLGEEIVPVQWRPDVYSFRSFIIDNDLFHIKVPEAIGTERAIYILNQNPNVKYAEKNMILHPFAVYPNDDHFSKQWGLFHRWNAFADIKCTWAWNIFKGSSNIVVAVIDTGVDYNHIDLATNIWINPGESGNGKETNGVDDDGNGYTDDWHGWDFNTGDPAHPQDNDPMDEWAPIFHGTHVAGIIGAIGNNDEGIAGVNWNVRIMALKASDPNADMPVSSVIEAIEYATRNGAHLSNNSYGYYYDDPDLIENFQSFYDAIKNARDWPEGGKLFIAAAGNDDGWHPLDNDIGPTYPASFDLENIISVAATDYDNNLAEYSHYGYISVDLGAPGGSNDDINVYRNIYSTMRYDQYQYMSGTSMAAPHVAGVAALVWGCRPDLNWSQVKYAIMNGVDYNSSLAGRTVTGGKLNAYRSLIIFPPPGPAAPSNLSALGYCWEVKLTWQDNSNNEEGFIIERQSGPYWYYLDYVGPNVTTYWDVELPCGQLWCYRVFAYNQNGNSPYSASKCTKTLPCYQCERGLSLKLSADKKDIASGESVTYVYELKNNGEFDLTDIELMDYKFGEIATKFTLKKGETKTFYKTVTLNETTTNFAEAAASYNQRNEIKNVKAHASATVSVKLS
jgi:subtilisin family serine protease